MRFQFTIRSMLLVTALVGVLLAIREPAVRKYGAQKTAAEKLRAVGARITVEPIRPAPLRWLVADGTLGPITTVRLEGCWQFGDSLAALADLPDLQRLYLPNSAVTDDHLQHVAGLAGIRRLALWRMQITERGFRHLEGLENLELLDIHGSHVSEDALPYLARLPHLRQIITTMTLTDHGLACLCTFAHHPRIVRGKVVVEGSHEPRDGRPGRLDIDPGTGHPQQQRFGGRVCRVGAAETSRWLERFWGDLRRCIAGSDKPHRVAA